MPSRQTQTTNAQHPWRPAQSWVTFTLLTLLLLWTIHAVVFFAHEYAHSFTAWLLGWKADPLDLNYGHLTTGNLLVQIQIDENVEYDPIFAAGHGWQAGLIAAAGMVLGNGLITYSISRWGYSAARRHGSRTWAMAFYWMCVASIGNFIDYVPVRTFSFHGDMHTLEKGFSCSPWWIMLVLGIPTAIALLHFLVKFEPQALQWLFPQSAARRGILVFLTAFIFIRVLRLSRLVQPRAGLAHHIGRQRLRIRAPHDDFWLVDHSSNRTEQKHTLNCCISRAIP